MGEHQKESTSEWESLVETFHSRITMSTNSHPTIPANNEQEVHSSSTCSFKEDKAKLRSNISSGINVDFIHDSNDDVPKSSTSFISKEQERKELILYLLAQVCALHDSTPKTFIVHVLSLYESGILDDESIRLLMNHGLVPNGSGVSSDSQNNNNHHNQEQDCTEFYHRSMDDTKSFEVMYDTDREREHEESTGNKQSRNDAAIVPVPPSTITSQQIIHRSTQISSDLYYAADTEANARARTVFAIRQHLEHHEAMENWRNLKRFSNKPNMGGGENLFRRNSSWMVEHHPLSFSRYNRDFIQKRLLASGSFGEVFHATNKLDNCDYAVKRVAFSASGYDTNQVELVIREVQCLAKMGHENVVRYYTSWLEPIWTPGGVGQDGKDDEHSSDFSESDNFVGRNAQLLLGASHPEDFDNVHRQDDESCTDNSGFSAWSLEKSNDNTNNTAVDMNQKTRHRSNERFNSNKSISTGGYGISIEDNNNSEYSEWTIDQSRQTCFEVQNRNATCCHYFESTDQVNHHDSSGHIFENRQQSKKKQDNSYKYHICLFIQMQLCKPSTLADWIKNRNKAKNPAIHHKRYLDASSMFKQISSGLAHVHSKGIIHRDLKPANIFQSVEDDTFKIGDFGLSKMLQSANGGIPFGQHVTQESSLSIVPITHIQADDSSWDNTLTAGVGTSSYAAPEQLSSQNYGSEADIFSLGLILLELVSNFGSAHERALTFQHCRKGILPDYLKAAPLIQVGELITWCTKKNPNDRPTAEEVLKFDLFSNTKVADMQESLIKTLELELSQKIEENKRLRQIIERQADQLRTHNLMRSDNDDYCGDRVDDVGEDDY